MQLGERSQPYPNQGNHGTQNVSPPPTIHPQTSYQQPQTMKPVSHGQVVVVSKRPPNSVSPAGYRTPPKRESRASSESISFGGPDPSNNVDDEQAVQARSEYTEAVKALVTCYWNKDNSPRDEAEDEAVEQDPTA